MKEGKLYLDASDVLQPSEEFEIPAPDPPSSLDPEESACAHYLHSEHEPVSLEVHQATLLLCHDSIVLYDTVRWWVLKFPSLSPYSLPAFLPSCHSNRFSPPPSSSFLPLLPPTLSFLLLLVFLSPSSCHLYTTCTPCYSLVFLMSALMWIT